MCQDPKNTSSGHAPSLTERLRDPHENCQKECFFGRTEKDVMPVKGVKKGTRIKLGSASAPFQLKSTSKTCSGPLVHRQVVGEKIAATGRAANESVDLVDRESVGNGKFSHWLWWKYFTNTICVKSLGLRLWVESLVFFRWCPQHPRIHWFARNSLNQFATKTCYGGDPWSSM